MMLIIHRSTFHLSWLYCIIHGIRANLLCIVLLCVKSCFGIWLSIKGLKHLVRNGFGTRLYSDCKWSKQFQKFISWKLNGIKNKHAPLWGELRDMLWYAMCCVCLCMWQLQLYFFPETLCHFTVNVSSRVPYSIVWIFQVFWQWLNLNLVLYVAPKKEYKFWERSGECDMRVRVLPMPIPLWSSFLFSYHCENVAVHHHVQKQYLISDRWAVSQNFSKPK
jgi:hypothetical protein